MASTGRKADSVAVGLPESPHKQEGGLEPGHGHTDVGDGAQRHLGVQVFLQRQVQTALHRLAAHQHGLIVFLRRRFALVDVI